MEEITKPVRAPTATLTAVEELKKQIFSGELPADSNHFEAELASRLGMSRTPVREATLMLEAHGLLEVIPRKGVRIKAFSVEDMSDIYEILIELESLAAKRAAHNQYADAELNTLAKHINAMEAALAKSNRIAWAQADEGFHFELVRLGGNQRILDIVAMYSDQVRRARAYTLHMRPLPTQSNEDHRALYGAIKKGDANGAFRKHRKHRQQTAKLIIKLLKQSGLKRL